MALAPTLSPSAWVCRWSHLLRPSGSVLDLACGQGRHVRWLSSRGFAVTAVDRDAQALAGLEEWAETRVADLESGPWPFLGRLFDGIVVTNYWWRPRFAMLLENLADGGVLIVETFAAGQQTVGRPSRPEFLLNPGELIERVHGLRIIAYEDGFEPGPDRYVQRVVAVRQGPFDPAHPPRYRLVPEGDR